jgi:hypothetical protein
VSVSDAGRTEAFNTIRDRLGPEVAAAIMNVTNPLEWTDVARSSDVRELSSEMRELSSDVRQLGRRMDGVEHRLDRIETALREQTHVYIGALVGLMAVMTAVVGLLVHL